jgi:amino-acid N-acetyltransferase
MSDIEARKPPEKIRVTKLQEAQLGVLEQMDEACAAQFQAAGFTTAQVAPRPQTAIARLTRDHDVLVAEADHEPAAYLAWADHPPGVAWLPIFVVAPEYQRLGIGTRMLRELGEIAAGHGIRAVVTPCWDRAAANIGFLAARGFQMAAGAMPEKVIEWLAQDRAELLQPGQTLWWASTDGLGTIPGLPRPPMSVR